MRVGRYIGLLSGFVRGLPRFAGVAEAVMRQAEELMDVVREIPEGFSVEAAEGVQLDLIGGAMGMRREDAADGSDETFRGYIRSKLALWRWDGSNEGVEKVLEEGVPGMEIGIRDRGDLTVEVIGDVEELPGRAEEVLPVPAGVRCRC